MSEEWNDEEVESLSDFYEDVPDRLEVIEGGPDPSQYSWNEEEKYLDDLDGYKEQLKTAQQSQMMADAVFDAASQGVAKGVEFAVDKDAKAAAVQADVMKYASDEDRALINEADALESEYDENEARLEQAELRGDGDEVDVCLRHRARIAADLEAMPREVPSVERARSESGLEWKDNILENWFAFSDADKEKYRPDLREAIEWSNDDDESRWMISVDPESGDLYRVRTAGQMSCREQMKHLKADERLKGVPEASKAIVANKAGLLGGWQSAERINPDAKTEAEEEAGSFRDIYIVTGEGKVFEEDYQDEKPKGPKPPKPQTNIQRLIQS